MSEESFDLQCMVLPKGIEGDCNLRVTLALAPSKAIRSDFNLPAVLRDLQEISLFLASGDTDDASLCIAKTSLRDEHRRVLDPTLWTRLMSGVKTDLAAPRARLGTAAAAKPPAGAAWRTSHAASVLQALNRRAEPPTAAAKAARAGARPVIAPIRRSLSVAWPTVSKAHVATRGAGEQHPIDADPLATALQHADKLFTRSDDTIDALADRLNDLHAVHPDDKEWQRLLSGYSPDGNKSPHDLLRMVGLRPNQATVEWLRRRLMAARGGAVELHPFGDMVLDQLLFSAPRVGNRAGGDGALKAESDADDTSMENRLAAFANEFALHPLLGLAIDLVFPCTISGADLHAQLRRDQVRVRVDLGMKPAAHQPWTLLTPEAWPKPRGGASVFDPGADGWCRMSTATLSNQESRSSVAKWRSALIAALDRRTNSAGGIRPVQVRAPSMQTSALIMHMQTLSDQTAQVIANGGLPGRNSERLNLEDVVVGIRPVLEITDTRQQRFPAALLGREIDYPEIESATKTLAQQLAGPPQSRDEGHIPVMRLSNPGEQENESTALVGTEQVFEWSGWNPAVPFPGAKLPAQSAHSSRLERLNKTIGARPGENLPYRYGLAVRAACRWVLRDGSSRLPANAAARASDAPWVGDGFVLKRHEPLRAPMVLRQLDNDKTPLLEYETATQVVLASLLDGPDVRESSVRYILPGAIRDLIDLDRHAVFDKGLPPTATAYPTFARGVDPTDPEKPESIFALFGREPMVVIRPQQHVVSKTKLYHPDPMTSHLRLVLVRTTSGLDKNDQHWYPVVDADGNAIQAEFALYDHQPWPNALALKVTFEARRRGDTREMISHMRVVDGILPLRIGVPAGERFTLMVLPIGDPDRLARQHEFRSRDVYDPQLSQITTIDVQHVLQRPQAPTLSPIAATARELQARAADLQVEFQVDSGSTTQVDLHAGWTDPMDDPQRGPPTDDSGSDTPKSGMLVATLGRIIGPVADAHIDDPEFNHPLRPPLYLCTTARHDMPDTRRRRVAYRLTAAGSNLLADWYAKPPMRGPPLAKCTDSAPQWISIPASARPLPPILREIQLAFRFDRTTLLTTSTSVRTCALSVVMERGWWSSGPGEMLAIAVSPVQGPEGKTNVQSTWAADPIRRSPQPFGPNLAADDFGDTAQVKDIEVTEGQSVRLVLFEPSYDKLADAWRVDVELSVRDSQVQPFVQLVLARYQPEAVKGAEISQTVVADYFQLPSNRSANVTFREDETEAIMEVVVLGAVDVPAKSDAEGAAQSRAGVSRLWAVVQRTVRAGVGAAVWIDTPCAATLSPDPLDPDHRQVARIKVPPHERRGNVRVAIFEQTEFQTGLDATCSYGPMHYFDVVPMVLIEPVPPG